MTITSGEDALGFLKTDFKGVDTAFDARIKEHVVFFKFDDDARIEFSKFTYGHIGKTVEIRVCGELIITPRIMAPIYGGAGRLTNLGSEEKAKDLSNKLKSGKCN